MIALLDLGLFVLSPDLWSTDRDRCLEPMLAMEVHSRHLRRYPVRLLWADDFFLGFPWNLPVCPAELRDACVVVQSLYEVLRGQNRLLTSEQLPPASNVAPSIEPALLDEDLGYPEDLCVAWLDLLGAAASSRAAVDAGLSVPSWHRPLIGDVRKLSIANPGACAALVDHAPLLLSDADWRAFLERYHRPDLRGRRVAVLGGSRAPFERARERLGSFGLTECRRLPPAYEEHRTAQTTKERLRSVELLLVCTNRMKHTDTDQLESVRAELTCAVVHLTSDGETQLVQAVIDHFRAQDERAATAPSGGGAS